MTVYRADWVLPIAEPAIRDAWVAVENGRIAGLGSARRADAVDLGRAAILPALVNAHTHLELSYLRGRVPPADNFLEWIRPVMDARRSRPDREDPAIREAVVRAIGEARASGTGLVGDISNTLVTVPLLRQAAMPARVFYELISFIVGEAPAAGVSITAEGLVRKARARILAPDGADPARRISLAAHAPYSVSPALFRAVRADLDAHRDDISSVHLNESPEEVEFIRHGTGGWRDVLVRVGAWNEAWRAPGCSPVAYLDELGFLDARVLAVHGVQCSGDDLERLRGRGATLVSCPRSNQYVGVGAPPLGAFFAMGVKVAFGTDSLASVQDLNMFAELHEARRLAPRVVARDLLEGATLNGALALGFGAELGSIEEGKQAALIAVRLPGRVDDVEEYLVSGIDPAAITWLDTQTPHS